MRMPLQTIDISTLQEEGDHLTFEYEDEFGQTRYGLVLLWEERLRAFENRCPHWKTPLDTHGPELWSKREGMLVCQTHGALFRPDDGYCEIGPCQGDALQKLEIEVVEEGRHAHIYRPGLQLL